MRRALTLRAVQSAATSAASAAALSSSYIAAASSGSVAIAAAASASSIAAPSPASAPRVRPPLPPRPRLNLLSLSLSQLESELSSMGLPRYRARQLLGWVYNHGVRTFDAMHGFTPKLRMQLAERFEVGTGLMVDMQIATDYTRKLLIGFPSAKSKLVVPTEASALTAAATAASCSSAALARLDKIEAVYIPMGPPSTWMSPSEGAVCVSSQVGCSLSCTFCHTGTMDKGALRNLSAGEIVEQVLMVQRAMGDYGAASPASQQTRVSKMGYGGTSTALVAGVPRRAVSNIVLMGMGEPLYNLRHVLRALHILTSSPSASESTTSTGGGGGGGIGGGFGLGFGRGRITLSTSGVVPGIDALLAEFGGNINLAISLHAASDSLRDELVPINRTWKLSALMDAVRRYQNGRQVMNSSSGGEEEQSSAADPSLNAFAPLSLAGRKRITFEYVMLQGINDSLSEALSLARLLDGVVALVNLIPFNPWDGSSYVSSDPAHIQAFAAELKKLGVPTTIRWPRGREIQGACGQLAGKHANTASVAAAGGSASA